MLIYYWCPFLSKIATIKAVLGSIRSFNKYSNKKNKHEIKLINACGEWNNADFNKIELINTLPFNLHKYLPKTKFLSRISLLIIALLNFFPLLFIIKNNKPKFIIIHLLTSLPLILCFFKNKKTKIILRISGLPNLNLFRKNFWKIANFNIHAITTPTELTRNDLIKENIFDEKKIILVRDPIINCKLINEKKKEKIDEEYLHENYYISLGRLTRQKNYKFLIDSYSKLAQELKIKKLAILGDGEEYNELLKLIKKNKMENNILLLGFKDNPYKYIYNSVALISTSLYEDPGFSLYEAIYLNKSIISSDCENGPRELSLINNSGFFFKNNDFSDFESKIKEFEKNILSNRSKIIAKKFSKNFTYFQHFKCLKKILD